MDRLDNITALALALQNEKVLYAMMEIYERKFGEMNEQERDIFIHGWTGGYLIGKGMELNDDA